MKIKVKIDSSLQRPDLDFLLSLGQQEREILQHTDNPKPEFQALRWPSASWSNVV